MSKPPDLHHLTLNTGHLRLSPRAEVSEEVIAVLRPLVAKGSAPVPGMAGWHLHFVFPEDGAVFFQIADRPGLSKTPVLMAIVAWQAEAAATAWKTATTSYKQICGPGCLAPPAMPPVPWLAVWLTPFAGRVRPDELFAFGDLERCVAWAVI